MPPSPSQAGLRSLEHKEPTASTAGAGEWAAQPHRLTVTIEAFRAEAEIGHKGTFLALVQDRGARQLLGEVP